MAWTRRGRRWSCASGRSELDGAGAWLGFLAFAVAHARPSNVRPFSGGHGAGATRTEKLGHSGAWAGSMPCVLNSPNTKL